MEKKLQFITAVNVDKQKIIISSESRKSNLYETLFKYN